MDMALCIFNFPAKKVEFAGANNPLLLIRNDTVIKFKGDRFPIGAFEGSKPQPFKNNKIDLLEGDCLYLSSDGYADQFGGPESKKFMFRRFEELLLEIHSQPMEVQKELLHKRLIEWMGANDQVDDILVIGIRV
jgi:serine phosphatase RsbU (regulator of sigma subunit)